MDKYILWGSDDNHTWVEIRTGDDWYELKKDIACDCYSHVRITPFELWSRHIIETVI